MSAGQLFSNKVLSGHPSMRHAQEGYAGMLQNNEDGTTNSWKSAGDKDSQAFV